MKPKKSGLFARCLRGRAVKAVALVFLGLLAGSSIRFAMARHDMAHTEGTITGGSVLSVPDSAETKKSETEPSKEVAEALAALGPPPTVAEVLDAVGLDRFTAFARYLAVADGEDCRRLKEALEERGESGNPGDSMICLRWTEVDPQGALAAGGSYPKLALWGLGKSDPETAIAEALRLGEPFLGAEVARAIAQEDAARGAELLRLHPEFGEWNAWEGMVSNLAKTDLRAAAEYAVTHGVNLDGTMKRWAETDPEGALAFALGQADARDRSKALGEVLGKLAESDPRKALEVVSSLPSGGMREELRNELLKQSAATDASQATEWARALPPGTERVSALHLVAAEICRQDPDTALALFLETLPALGNSDLYGRQGHFDGLGRKLAATNPVATLSALAGSTADNSAAQTIAGHWVRLDPEAASTWIGEQPPGPKRDTMVTGLVNAIIRDANPDFGSAAIWALSLDAVRPGNGGNQQTPVLRNVFQNWLHRDRAAALEAMRHEGMPPEIQSLYEREMERPR